MAEIVPAILVQTKQDYVGRLKFLEQHGHRIQIDLMDGKFVPNTTVGPETLKKHPSGLFQEGHLMVVEPEKVIADYLATSLNLFTFHLEATKDPGGVIEKIKAAGRQVGVAINPETPVEALAQYEGLADLMLLMSVQPGKGGQEFISETYEKIRHLRQVVPHALIEVDGGISLDNARAVALAGADLLVVGTGIFETEEPAEILAQLEAAVRGITSKHNGHG